MFVIINEIETNILNVGSNEEISIFDLAGVVKEVTGFKGNLDFDESKPDGNPRKLLDSSKIFNLGWKPKTDLKEGIKITYDWYLNNVKNL